jgi:signal transduction histidine kinase
MRIVNKVLPLLVLQIILLIGHLTAQPDSLLVEFKKTPKSVGNISKLIDLSYNLIDYNVDSALSCAVQIRQISIPDTAYDLHCKVLINLGNIEKVSGKYNESNKYLFQALEIAERNNLISSKIITLYQIGDLDRCIGILDQSLMYLYMSKDFAHKNKVSQQYPELYEHISSTFYQLTGAIYPKFKSAKIPNQNEFNFEKSTTEDFIKLCKIYADSALMFSELNNDNKTKLSCLNILGAYSLKKRNYKQAIEYFGKAIEMAEQINYKIDIPNYYINIARTYFDEKQYGKAIENGLKAYQMAMDMNILIHKSASSNVLYTSYMKMKDYDNALKYQKIQADVREEINDQQNWNKIVELEKKYQTEQKQKEIEYQKTLLDLKNTEIFWRNIILACMLIACIIVLIGIFYIQKQNKVLIRQKKKIEAQSEKITEQYGQLEELDHFKESLTHALVHDLKNPLSQIMASDNNPAVINPARKMLRLIMNMLDVEKYENTKFILNKEVHCLRNLLAEVRTGQEIGLKEKNLELRFLFDDFWIQADKEVIIRVLDNLLANAIRFSPLNLSIDILAEQLDDKILQISVINYGEPIPDEVLPYIFDKYRHFGKTDGKHSTGLGLTFCKMAVEAHGGKIGVSCNSEKGCNFWFTIPSASKTVEFEGINNFTKDENHKLQFSKTDLEALKEVVKQVKEFEIYEISRFHEILDPLKDTSGSVVNEWISLMFGTINVQNIDEFNRLINLAENGQTKDTDCR